MNNQLLPPFAATSGALEESCSIVAVLPGNMCCADLMLEIALMLLVKQVGAADCLLSQESQQLQQGLAFV